MSELSELEGTDLLLALCRRRVRQWEGSEPGGRREFESAEAFTRAFAELDIALKDGGELPKDWLRALRPQPQVITDDIALGIAAAVLETMNRHSLAETLRELIPYGVGHVQGHEHVQPDEHGIYPVRELFGSHTARIEKDGPGA